ncbi:MAG TPA: EAL domain-containing protein, partial [Spirochaetota bacterium]|nr:EAL domain-containing protein [Spirochaetota bacterium]
EFSFSPPIRVNVNLSARQFVLDELCERIFRIVEEYRVPPESLAFEITESAFMEDMESANLMLLKLKAGKHRIYMDDFGTGYSSLSYLQHFPVDTLKIDKSFVEWMHIDEQSEQIVRAIIDLAHNLKMTVVAEGVEVDEHRDVLKKYGCDYGQGYYFSKPLDVPAARQYLRKMKASKLV